MKCGAPTTFIGEANRPKSCGSCGSPFLTPNTNESVSRASTTDPIVREEFGKISEDVYYMDGLKMPKNFLVNFISIEDDGKLPKRKKNAS